MEYSAPKSIFYFGSKPLTYYTWRTKRMPTNMPKVDGIEEVEATVSEDKSGKYHWRIKYAEPRSSNWRLGNASEYIEITSEKNYETEEDAVMALELKFIEVVSGLLHHTKENVNAQFDKAFSALEELKSEIGKDSPEYRCRRCGFDKRKGRRVGCFECNPL